MVSYRLVGTGVTDSNGVATCNYTGSGKGKVDFVASTDNASHISEGSLQSEIYTLWDTIFYLKGDTDTSNWAMGDNCSVSYSSEGTHFLASGTGGNQVNLYRNSSTHSFDGTKDTVFEFDIKVGSAMALYIVDNGGGRRSVQQNIQVNTWLHIKWEYKSDTQIVTPYIDGVAQTPVDLSSYNLTTIGLQIYDWQGDMDIWFKNFKVY